MGIIKFLYMEATRRVMRLEPGVVVISKATARALEFVVVEVSVRRLTTQ